MSAKVYIIILAAIIFVHQSEIVFAEENVSNNQIGLSIFGGFDPGGKEVEISFNYPNGKLSTAMAYGAGIHVGHLSFIKTTKLNLSFEMIFYDVESNIVTLSPGSSFTAQYFSNSIPLLVWAEVDHTGEFGPFIKVGAGSIYHEIKYEFYPQEDLGFEHDRWLFAYAVGGGLRFTPTPNIDLLAFAEGITGIDEEINLKILHWDVKLDSQFRLSFYGIRIRYWF